MAAVPLGARLTVQSWEAALVFRDGAVVERLGPGTRRVWNTRCQVRTVDLRPWVLAVPTQEVPTADGVTVKVTAAALLRVVDAEAFVVGAVDPHAALYLAVQVALRELVGATSVDDLVATRRELGDRLVELVRGADDVGVAVDAVQLKDIVLPADLKRARAQVLLARAEGQAALERARGETAALRALANAARLTASNPSLLQLRLLQQLATSTGHTVVLGTPFQPFGATGNGRSDDPGTETPAEQHD
jgi:regulator of protease activity HflC (stomatin/prohibitin superfamily)